ncbi:FxsA family protein [Dactylosporangium darangshiense]|uniref:FxsA cytoplasmic membrane protein n=1 Tax=Dactylosporangium darangshiense TaxID=579108 RepID=A0ABP8DGK0_9ACTN
MRGLGWTTAGAFLLVIAEITVFVLVARWIGWGWAILLGLATMALGGMLIKREGVRAWRRFRTAVNEGRPAGGEVSDGLTGLLGALLLIVPGFITDAAGLLLLVPPVRAFTGRQVRRVAERRISPAAAGDLFGPRVVRAERHDTPTTSGETPAGDVVEGEIVDPHPHQR